MNYVCDVVMTELRKGVSQRTGKQFNVFNGVIVGCNENPLLTGIAFNKFVSDEVYAELSQLTQDRSYLNIGLSKAGNASACDIGFNLFINGVYKGEPDAPVDKK